MKVVGNSPAALEGYLGLSGALAKGTLGAKTGERIALAIAEFNGCSYCLSAHSYLAKNVARLDDAEIAANRERLVQRPQGRRRGTLRRRRRGAARPRVGPAVAAVKAAGYNDAQVDRNRAARRAQHADQLRQRSREDGDRLSGGRARLRHAA